MQAGSSGSRKRQPRPTPTLDQERRLWESGITRLAAVDEVGRGCLAGWVVAAAVIFPPDLTEADLTGIRDSKQLSRSQREQYIPLIKQHALTLGIGSATPAEIDQINIRRATALAIQRALEQIDPVHHVLVDGLRVPELEIPQTAVVKGDAHCLTIAAASILAKVTRDQWMIDLDHQHPGYGWASNVGYGTPQHRQALHDLGLTDHHRRTFIHSTRLEGSS